VSSKKIRTASISDKPNECDVQFKALTLVKSAFLTNDD
jgi:hypothetical protein